MSLTDRDRKIVFGLVPILLLAGFWFLVLAPKRDQAASAEQRAAKQEQRADTARAQLAQANQAETDFASDYGEIVRLGKAVPAQVDMPSLIVQLDEAAEGTGIRFTKIATGDRTTAGTASSTAPPVTPPPSGDAGAQNGTGSTPAAAGGEQAQSAPGAAAESANNAAATSNQRNAAAEQSGVSAADTQTSTSSGQGLPVGGGTATGASAAGGASSVAGLETMPLELEFTGDFFNLADFFHDVKRFVRVAGTNVVVGGRLITIEGVNYSSDPELFPKIKAEIKATVYLSPKAEGTSAGATPAGPPSTTPASTPAGVEDSAPAAPAPTAAATP
ncbi:MAG TPA: type II secretion system protein GspM [Thermoleophilaceae bacterium]|nr:type II secretion system protein GspM [Thermoleophilaceae bacterium]